MENRHPKQSGRRKKEKPVLTALIDSVSTIVIATIRAPKTDLQHNNAHLELHSKRLDLDLAEDPNYKQKLKVIDYGIEVLDLFQKLSKVIELVAPNALGVALLTITAILEGLKVRSESASVCKHSLRTLARK